MRVCVGTGSTFAKGGAVCVLVGYIRHTLQMASDMRRRRMRGGVVPLLALVISALLVGIRADTRPPECGDFALDAGEVCDDGNAVAGDGCSGTCTIETGYMCEYHYRTPEQQGTPGVRYEWGADKTVTLTAEAEACEGTKLCAQGSLWVPENWASLYEAGAVLPPGGYYCGSMCEMFAAPVGYRVNAACDVVGVNECIEGLAACAFNAECEDKLPHETTTGNGYVCRCDSQYFTTDANGMGCAQAGVEITVIVAGKPAYDPAEDPPPDRAVVQALRGPFIDLLLAQNYATGVTREALLEGVEQYDPELVSASGVGDFSGRALWALKVRIASAQANLAMVSAGALWRDAAQLGTVFTAGEVGGVQAHLLHTSSRCANDDARQCVLDADCLGGAACSAGVPDVQVAVLSAGGSRDSITVPSSGIELVSVTYDVTQTAWTARLRYDDTVADTMDVLYVSHMPVPLTAEAQSTFRPDEFPCLPVGTGQFQQRRADNVCCLAQVDALYTTVTGFGDYLGDGAGALGAALARNGPCETNGAPPNATDALLDTSQDFVAGPLARMTRSTATLDTVITHGYQDVIVFLAEEDMRAFGGIQTDIDGGFRLEFFIGMAHLRATSTQALSAAFSHVKVTAEITQTYMFTTTAETESTFVDDINVNLVQVRTGAAGSEYLKFARVQVTLPASLQAPTDVAGIIPLGSARATTGFSVDSADAPVYPCLAGDLTALAATLAGLEWCAFADPLCAPVGPAPIGAGNQVYFIFPLPTGFWSEEQLDSTSLLSKFLFLDFMISAFDAAGKRVYDRVQTRTQITRLSVAAQCETQQITAGITDIMEIDLFLGLAPSDALFDESLVQALDITSGNGPTNMVREQSSTASNVLTMLIKGAPETFAQSYASEYALEVEDMVTLHFIDAAKKATVENLINLGLAFETYAPAGSESLMRMRPTQALLELCPVHATKDTFGCITRRDIQERMHDVVTQSVFKFSPHNATVRDDTFDAAGRWLQTVLGASDFAYELGRSHAQVMTDRFQLEDRYRLGYLLKPTIPWRQTEMDQQGVASVLELSQFSLTAVMVAFDQNVGETYSPTTQVSMQVTLPMPSGEFGVNAALQQELAAAYADTLGLGSESVAVDESGGGRRRLLSLSENTHEAWARGGKDTQLDINIELSLTDKNSAQDVAEALRTALSDPTSDIATTLRHRVARITARHASGSAGAGDVQMSNVQVRPISACTPAHSWRTDAAFGAAGWLTCSARGVHGKAEVPLGPRGARTAADWQLLDAYNSELYDPTLGIPRSEYSLAFDSSRVSHHWLWWDLCGPLPAGAGVDAASWERMRALVTKNCCACGAPGATPAQQSTPPWPAPAHEELHARILPVNPQGRDPVWAIGPDAHAKRRVPCRAGAHANGASGQCTPCPRGSFLEGSSCTTCPLVGQTTAHMYATAASACVCDAGLFLQGGACVPCPRSTYKSALGDAPALCVACAGSRAGSNAAAQCTPPRSILFESALGALSYHTPLHAEWASPAPAAQPQQARCVHTPGALSCPARDYATAHTRVGAREPVWIASTGLDVEYADAAGHPRAALFSLQEGHRAAPGAAFSERLETHTPGATLVHELHMHLPSTPATTPIFAVSMLTTRKLGPDDWQWLVCGSRAGTPRYARCRAGPDPDAPAHRNAVNTAVLDLAVHELVRTPETRSCFSPENGWPSRCNGARDPRTFQGVWEWTPDVPAREGPVWVYTFFLVGDSEACRLYGCDEGIAHTRTPQPQRTHRLALLPGFEVRLRTPPPAAPTSVSLATASELLGGAQGLHFAAPLPAAPAGATELALELHASLNVQHPNVMYDILAFTTPRGAAPAPHWARMLCTARAPAPPSAPPRALLLQSLTGALRKNSDAEGQRFEGFATHALFEDRGGFVPLPARACDLQRPLDAQPLPCSYTKAQVLARYSGQRPRTREVDGVEFPCYTAPLGASNTTVTAFGRACAGKHAVGDCRCGTVFEAWALDSTGTYTRRIARAVGSGDPGATLVTELSPADIASRHVLAQNVLAPGATLHFLEFSPEGPTASAQAPTNAVCAGEAANAALLHAFDPAACCSAPGRCAKTCPGDGAYAPATNTYTWHTRAHTEPRDLHIVLVAPPAADSPLGTAGAAACARPSYISRIGSSLDVRVTAAAAGHAATAASNSAARAVRPAAHRTARPVAPRGAAPAAWPKRGPSAKPAQRSRRLLIASPSQSAPAASPGAQSSMMRETKGIDTPALVSEGACKGSTSAVCTPLSVAFGLTEAEYCTPQEELIASKHDAVREYMRKVSAQPSLEIKILFVNRPDFIQRCVLASANTGSRRLLDITPSPAQQDDFVDFLNAHWTIVATGDSDFVLQGGEDTLKNYGASHLVFSAKKQEITMCSNGHKPPCDPEFEVKLGQTHADVVKENQDLKKKESTESSIVLIAIILAVLVVVFVVATVLFWKRRSAKIASFGDEGARLLNNTNMYQTATAKHVGYAQAVNAHTATATVGYVQTPTGTHVAYAQGVNAPNVHTLYPQSGHEAMYVSYSGSGYDVPK